MAKNPLFSSYRTGENRVTASMLAVFERINASVLERLLAGASEESSLTFVKFANQPAGIEGTVPDAEISASFHYIFEVKTEPNALRGKQLDGHLGRFAGTTHKDERLIVITPDPEQPSIISERAEQPLPAQRATGVVRSRGTSRLARYRHSGRSDRLPGVHSPLSLRLSVRPSIPQRT